MPLTSTPARQTSRVGDKEFVQARRLRLQTEILPKGSRCALYSTSPPSVHEAWIRHVKPYRDTGRTLTGSCPSRIPDFFCPQNMISNCKKRYRNQRQPMCPRQTTSSAGCPVAWRSRYRSAKDINEPGFPIFRNLNEAQVFRLYI